jgi:hypothetical protein
LKNNQVANGNRSETDPPSGQAGSSEQKLLNLPRQLQQIRPDTFNFRRPNVC